MAVGRLDVDSEGLLLLTTDGKLSHDIRSKKVEKEYFVQVDGLIDQTAINTMKAGVEIGIKRKKYLTDPCKASMIDDPPDFPVRTKRIRDERHGPTSWASIIITEGKYRQVRKMTAAVGFPTLRLIRVRIGDIHLADLNPGEVREVTDLSIA
jgi:23S rRNA pseudouridine2457 synthase